MNKKRIISGITATGKLTIGNYIGAIKNFIKLQQEYEMFIFVANMHAITLPIKPSQLYENTLDIAAIYLAAGLDPNKCNVFIQSEIKDHAQLAHIILCNTTMGELSRMTQFKDKSSKVKKNNNTYTIPTGLFTYPALMAADILLYKPTLVPVGADQKQHVELTNIIRERMNKLYGNIFPKFDYFIPKTGAKIMSLIDPTKKMSKSSSEPKSYILLLDDIEVARKKIMIAKTDSENKVYFDLVKKPGISNLLVIYSCLTTKTIKEIEDEYQQKNYKEFKEGLANVLCDFLSKFQTKYYNIRTSPNLIKILEQGKLIAQEIATKTMNEIENKVGLKNNESEK